MLRKVVNEKSAVLHQQAEENTTRTSDGTIVAAHDDVWREKVLVYVEVAAVKRFVEQKETIYAQLPCIRSIYFDFEYETNGFLPLQIEAHKLLETHHYYEVEIPVYRHRDLTMLQALIEKEGAKS